MCNVNGVWANDLNHTGFAIGLRQGQMSVWHSVTSPSLAGKTLAYILLGINGMRGHVGCRE